MTSSNSSFLRQVFTRLSLILALGGLPLLTGCVAAAAGVAAGAGAIAWVRGELVTALDQDLNRVFEATRTALKQLEFTQVSEKKDAIEAEFVHRTALDKKVTIKLNKVTDKTTRVRIRIDILGDEALSVGILEKIKANL